MRLLYHVCRAWLIVVLCASAAPSADPQSGRAEQLTAEAHNLLAFLLGQRQGTSQQVIDDAVGLLGRSAALGDADGALRGHCQDIAINAIIASCLKQSDSYDQLVSALDRVEPSMIDRGIPAPIAKLARLAAAVESPLRGRDEQVEGTLRQLEFVVLDDRVTAVRRAQYWDLWADLHQRRRNFVEAFDACREFERSARMTGNDDILATAVEQSAAIALRIGDYELAGELLKSTANLHSDPLPAPPAARLDRLRRDIDWYVNRAKALEGAGEYVPAQRQLEEALALLSQEGQQRGGVGGDGGQQPWIEFLPAGQVRRGRQIDESRKEHDPGRQDHRPAGRRS